MKWIIIFALLIVPSIAQASVHKHHFHHAHKHYRFVHHNKHNYHKRINRVHHRKMDKIEPYNSMATPIGHVIGDNSKPGAWCGWYMRQLFGGGPELNLAANWAKVGRAVVAEIGAIVVWPHHVGLIVGKADNGQFIVKSGNDGHAIRERARSIAGAIAFREL